MAITEVMSKPTDPGALGHYRTSVQFSMVATQAATSRIFEIRNTAAATIMVVNSLQVTIFQTANHTAQLDDSIDLYKPTGFSAVDNTNVVTPTITSTRTTFPAAGAAVRHVTIAGAAAGMTGGTITLGSPIWQAPILYVVTTPTNPPFYQTFTYQPQVHSGESPLVLVQNEGICLTNRVVFGAAGTASVYVNVEWTETTAY